MRLGLAFVFGFVSHFAYVASSPVNEFGDFSGLDGEVLPIGDVEDDLSLAEIESLNVKDSNNNILNAMYMNRTTNTIRIKDDIYGVRTVNYWVTHDNKAVIDGDVLYPGTLDDFLSKEYAGDEEEGPSVERRSLSFFRGAQTWPRSTVFYKYYDAATEFRLRTIVPPAMSEWKRLAPYLTFHQLPNSPAQMNGVVTITTHSQGCFASLGYSFSSMQLNLQQPGCYYAEALHEIGHNLGKS
ncbi:hypothetical protein CPC08DRAFT_371710 [Agrocybe pediades]|nr:hypothetical protein CPC08DRAFT_371710 [Agrocybe pediades]